MVTVVTREANGIPLTHDQVDSNFTGLADAINNLGDDVLAPAIAAKDAGVAAANSASASADSSANSANAASISSGSAEASAEQAANSAATFASPTGSLGVGFTQVGPESVVRSTGLKLQDQEHISARDKGATGNNVTDDTVPVASAIASKNLLSAYKVSAYNNNPGFDVTPDGVAVEISNARVYNPSQQKFMQVFGAETLQHWFSLFAGNSNTVSSGDGTVKRMVLSGDSVTFGFGNTTGVPTTVFSITAQQRGYKNVFLVNRGQSGIACFQWLASYLDGDLAENPDLLVLGWGDNDFGLGRTAEQLLADYRTGLTRLRAAKTPAQMSIILRTPTTMSDPTNNRTEWRVEQVIEGFKQLARDFQCGFVDVYSMLQNSHDAAGVWMDALPGAVHPLDVMQEHICAAIAELALPDYGSNWKNNAVYNCGSSTITRSATELPNYYFDGVTMIRTRDGNVIGSPYDGIFYTLKQADSAVLQWCTPLPGATPGYGISARLGFNNAWGKWLGVVQDLVPLLVSGWTAAPSAQNPSFWFSLDGAVNLQGTISPGTLADGTTVCTLPAGYRPAAGTVHLVATSSGFARLAISSDGSVKIYGAAGVTYLSLNGVIFKG